MVSRYSEELKREALRVCEQQGVRTTSEKLDIHIKPCTYGNAYTLLRQANVADVK